MTPPPVAAVLETCLYAIDLETVARFYREVLRLEACAEELGRHVFFRVGQGVFLLFNPERTAAESRGPSGASVPGHGARGPGHVAFAVREADVAVWRVHLAAEGVPIEAEIEWPGGGKSLYVRDPAGNSVELATPRLWGFTEPS